MIAKLLRLVSLSLTLIFTSEQILFAFPGEVGFSFGKEKVTGTAAGTETLAENSPG